MKKLSFEENLIDMVAEQQLKLGYLPELVRFYYPLQSLNRFFEASDDVAGMRNRLEQFLPEVEERLGRLEVSAKGDRFCIGVPPRGAAYVHGLIEQGTEEKFRFLLKLISLVGTHGTTLADIHELFHSVSERVIIEKVSNGEFDELIRFPEGAFDPYYYCFKDEMCHVIYHRYTPEDYRDLGL